jgi:hypothetical protein
VRVPRAASQAEPITAAIVPIACTQAATAYQKLLMFAPAAESSASSRADQARRPFTLADISRLR